MAKQQDTYFVLDGRTGEYVEVGVPVITVEKAQERLTKNGINRPLRSAKVKEIALEILRGTYEFNGEPIILDDEENIGNGQHNLHGLLLAEKWRQANPTKWKKYGVRGPLTIRKAIVKGVRAETFNTLDTAGKRTAGDVLFREGLWAEKKFKAADRKQLSNDLAVAVRLVWLRAGGMQVSDAPKFPHSEMLRVQDKNKKLRDFVEFVYTTDKEQGKAISRRVSRGYMAGMMYLYAMAEGSEKFAERHAKAEEILVSFALGTEMSKGDPLYELREFLTQSRENAGSRDEKVHAIVKALAAYDNGSKIEKRADLKLKKNEPVPRFGGLDSEPAPEPAEGEEGGDDSGDEPAAEPAPKRKPRRKAAAK